MSNLPPSPEAPLHPRVTAGLLRVASLLPAPPVLLRRLGGLTNANYLIESAGQKFVLRLPGEGTADYINRQAESVAARATAEIGVNAALLLFDAADGTQLTSFIDGQTMTTAAFKDHGAIARAAAALATVHRTSRPFASRFEVFAMIEHYSAVLAAKGAKPPEGFAEALQKAQAVRAVLAAAAPALAPCHCDPLAENFVDTGSKMHLLDWEYAGNNDPMWDLGDVSIEARFDAAQEAVLLESYFAGPPPPGARARVILYKAMCNLLWTLWASIQHANGNPVDDFWAYAVDRLTQSRATMASPDFAWALGAAGP